MNKKLEQTLFVQITPIYYNRIMKNHLDGKNLWEKSDQDLALYAQKNKLSQGRQHEEAVDPNRLPFQRDRDRIIHTTSFRRLQGKMQVVSPKYGDHFRNRLSHSIEVAQVSRDLARQLRLNEDLVEAIALAHDLGHPPFGHMGELMLDKKMKKLGSNFDHNKQSLRVVTQFERRYLDFPGLNLSHEVLEGIQKHETFFDRPASQYIYSPHLEAQLVDIADEIAYLSADLEDGLRGNFFTIEDLGNIKITARAIAELEGSEKKHRSTIIRRIIRYLLIQIVDDTEKNIEKLGIKTIEDVQCSKKRIVYFNSTFFKEFRELKNFLFQHYYLDPIVKDMTNKGEAIISKVFDFYYKNQEKMPQDFLPDVKPARRVCDYIAGMTDDFLTQLYKKIS